MSVISRKKSNFQIEAVKSSVVRDRAHAERNWKSLECATLQIYNNNVAVFVYSELFRMAYSMVTHKFRKKLYSGLKSTMTLLISEAASVLEAWQGPFFLEELNMKWTQHNTALLKIRDVLKTFVPRTHKTQVQELGLKLWRDIIIHSRSIQIKLKESFLEFIQKERGGEVINKGPLIMRSIVKMLMELSPAVYQNIIAKPFLNACSTFYLGESQQLIKCCDSGDYLKKVEKCLYEEIERVSHYLDKEIKVKITNVIEKAMIKNQMTSLIHMKNSGLVYMIVNDKYEDLRRMYNFFCRFRCGLMLIRVAMKSHIRGTWEELVTDPKSLKDPVEVIQRLLDEKEKYQKIINLTFNYDITFQNVLNSLFKIIINLNTRFPEFISLFVDVKLRKGVSEEDVQIMLEKVTMLLSYLQEKDLFEKYYTQHLAKRLLSGKSVSEDSERSLIAKLKTKCGCHFTSKLEVMFSDMKMSQGTMKGFYDEMWHKLIDVPVLAVHVLRTGSWPIQSTTTCNLPPEIVTACHIFESYYLGTHSKRRLTWKMNMGSADIKVTFSKGRKHELNVSTYQMCVLMMFNNADRLTYKEIKQAVGIRPTELKQCLWSLVCVKGKNVLRKEPMSEDIGEDDDFFFNDKFSSKFYKVEIGMEVTEESEEDKKETRKGVEEDRKPQIEAAIVRIMKAERVLNHNDIVAAVVMQLQSRFVPNPVGIEKGIESLIAREFLERDREDTKLYRYLA